MCIIYLHGNASSQLEGLYVPFLVQDAGIHTLLLDLSGSGHSDGDFISLGYYERDDVIAACEYLRTERSIDRIILWGRSMGASLGLWCAGDGVPGVVGCIADSPYMSAGRIFEDVSGRSLFLGVIGRMLWRSVDSNVKKQVGIGIDDIDIWNSIPNATVPCFLVHGIHDEFIAVRQSREIIARYGCPEKYLWTLPGGHESQREVNAYVMMIEFVHKIFGLEVNLGTKHFKPAAEMRPDGMHYRNPAEMAKDI
jgi:pimeloyl-ACP methyl ester carboxylesterase